MSSRVEVGVAAFDGEGSLADDEWMSVKLEEGGSVRIEVTGDHDGDIIVSDQRRGSGEVKVR